jgi:hypothetical protein
MVGVYPRNAITGWGPALLKLAMHLSVAAYRDDFSEFDGEILYANREVDFEQPVYYVYLLDGNLWVINRGAESVYDFLSCGDFNETTTDHGTFHLGAYRSALFTLQGARPYVESFNGTVYFTGHSFGGTVAPINAIITSDDYPSKDINGIGFAPLPMVDDATNARHREKLASIVNDVDIVPTLSVPNLYVTFADLIPFFQEIDEGTLVAVLEGVLDAAWIFLPTDLYNALREDIPAIADALLAYSHGEQRLVRYPPGHVYQLREFFPRRLQDTEIDPTVSLNALSISVFAFMEHNAGSYEEVVDELPDDQKYGAF